MSGECCRCGECCRYFVVNIPSNLAGLRYLKARGFHVEQGMMVAEFPCPHLVGDESRTTSCAVWEHRPIVCRQFQGLHRSGGRTWYVPDRCTLGRRP